MISEFADNGRSTSVIRGYKIVTCIINGQVAGVVSHRFDSTDDLKVWIEDKNQSFFVFSDDIIIPLMLKNV